jgi:3-hydroxyacyl-CoA dehydrogenase
MSETVTTSQREGTLVITIDNPPVNAITAEILAAIAAAVAAAGQDPAVHSIVLTAANRLFAGGADIRMLTRVAAGELPPLDFNTPLGIIENSFKPVIAALPGAALGGGLELAMACHYRIASAHTKLGQPEVSLGLIPGAGGTQRLPRLAGVARALEMCAFGETLSASDALAAGILDRLADDDPLPAALAFAAELPPVRRTRDRQDNLAESPAAESLAALTHDACLKRFPRQTAPLAAVDAVAAACRLAFDEGLAYERKRFEECLASEQSQALIHLFFAERATAGAPALSDGTQPLPVRQAAVAGAGMMGSGIAMCFANAGLPVLLADASAAQLARALETIRANYEASARKGRLTASEVEQRLALIRPAHGYDGFETADIVVEAVFEDLPVKQQVFRELDHIAKAGAVLATNTSTLDIDHIAAATARADCVAGMHFFSPAQVMRLVEVVRGKATAPHILATLMQLSRKLKKIPVLSGNCFGFIGNRMFSPYRAQAVSLVEQGCSPRQVDDALTSWGMAMGPLAVGDLVGLDVYWLIRQEALRLDVRHTPATSFEDELYKLGRYGHKTRSGWYAYDDKRRPLDDAEVARLVREYASWQGIEQREFSQHEIRERTLLALINEGARVLEEGIAQRASDIDIVFANGFGFPAWRGGPMHYARSLGWPRVQERLQSLYDKEGPFWKPASGPHFE